ncbi:MAG: hypothetical protein QXO75_06875, partial [Nitrososphaerota archaeon]
MVSSQGSESAHSNSNNVLSQESFSVPPMATSWTVTFSESGLPSGATWNVTLNGVRESSNTASISFTESNGTYPYTIGIYQGFKSSPYSSNVTVNGADVTVSVTFTKVAYTVVFEESGLPTGHKWSVTLIDESTNVSTTLSSNTPYVNFTSVANGSYFYNVTPLYLFSPIPIAGTFNVTGAGMTIDITFVEDYVINFVETG